MEEKIAVATIVNEVYKTELVVGKHHLLADEPEDVGGKDLGPHPGDYLRMSLASCTAITLRMYANRKQFEVDKIQVFVTTKETEGGTQFESNIEITGRLNEEEKQRMLQIAKRCPVHKVLTNPIEVVTKLTLKG